jgi:hypothetical protein
LGKTRRSWSVRPVCGSVLRKGSSWRQGAGNGWGVQGGGRFGSVRRRAVCGGPFVPPVVIYVSAFAFITALQGVSVLGEVKPNVQV